MSFLGVFGWLSYVVISSYGDGTKALERKKQKNKAKVNNQPYYWYDGQPYDILNDKPCIPSQKMIDGKWHTVLIYDDENYRDITEEIKRIKNGSIKQKRAFTNDDDITDILTKEYHNRIEQCKNSFQLYSIFFLLFEATMVFIAWQSKDWSSWSVWVLILVVLNIVFIIYKINQIATVKKEYKNKGVEV